MDEEDTFSMDIPDLREVLEPISPVHHSRESQGPGRGLENHRMFPGFGFQHVKKSTFRNLDFFQNEFTFEILK